MYAKRRNQQKRGNAISCTHQSREIRVQIQDRDLERVNVPRTPTKLWWKSLFSFQYYLCVYIFVFECTMLW